MVRLTFIRSEFTGGYALPLDRSTKTMEAFPAKHVDGFASTFPAAIRVEKNTDNLKEFGEPEARRYSCTRRNIASARMRQAEKAEPLLHMNHLASRRASGAIEISKELLAGSSSYAGHAKRNRCCILAAARAWIRPAEFKAHAAPPCFRWSNSTTVGRLAGERAADFPDLQAFSLVSSGCQTPFLCSRWKRTQRVDRFGVT